MESDLGYRSGGLRGGNSAAVAARVTALENKIIKVYYYEEITAVSGTITAPTGATIQLDQWSTGEDALVCSIANGQPTFESGGIYVSSFDASGNYVLSGSLPSNPAALIYVFDIKRIDFDTYVDIDKVVHFVETGFAKLTGADFTGPITATNLSGTNTGDQDLSNYIQGSGSVGYIPKFSATRTITNSLIYDNGTNVGIGITPTEKLDVGGGIGLTTEINQKGTATQLDINPYVYLRVGRLTNDPAFGLAVLKGDATTTITNFLSGSGNSYLGIGIGRVGIGVTSPASKFEVLAGTSNTEIARFGGTVSARGLRISGFAVGGTNEVGTDFNAPGAGGAAALSFSTQSLIRQYIDSNGNVGIGTSEPRNTLSVVNAAAASPPALGSATGVIFSALAGNAYGLIMGASSTGNGWIQAQRVDGTATGYNLILQPTSGNVGIGTSTPQYNLEVESTDNNPALSLSVKNAGSSYTTGIYFNGYTGSAQIALARIAAYQTANGATGELRFYTAISGTTSEKMQIASSGNVGIGGVPTSKLQIFGGDVLIDNNHYYAIKNITGTAIRVVVINSSNDVYLGGIDTGVGDTYIRRAGATRISLLSTSTTISSNTSITGTVTATSTMTATDFILSSSKKFKKNIKPFRTLEKLLQLEAVTFEWNNLAKKHNAWKPGKDFGLIAEDVQKVLPEVVYTKDDGYLGIAYGRLAVLAIDGVKEQHYEHLKLKSIVENQSKKIDSLEKKILSLEKQFKNNKSSTNDTTRKWFQFNRR